MGKRKTCVCLLTILLGGALLRLVFYTGPYSVDDYKYAQHAHELFRLKQTLNEDVALYREYIKTEHKFFIPPTKLFVPIYIPIAFFYKIFGVSTWTTFIWPFLCSMGKIVIIFFLAKIIFQKAEIGLLAAGLLSFFPLSTIFATRLTPDEISNFFTGLTVLFFLIGAQRKFGGYLAGVMLGITYMVRCYVIVLFLPFLIYACWKKKIFNLFLPAVTGFLIVFGIENILFLLLHFIKDIPFIFRLKVERDMMFYLNTVMVSTSSLTLIKEFPRHFFDFNIMGLYYYFLIPALFYLFFKKKLKILLVPLAWFFYYLLCLWFLPIDWKSYLLPMRDPRYLDMLTIPMILIMAFFISEVMARRKYRGRVIVILLLVSSFYSMAIQIYIFPREKYQTESFKIVADILKIISPKPLYCDNPTVSTKINYYFDFNPSFSLQRSVKLTPDISDVYVVIHDFREDPPLDKEGIISSIKSGEVLGGRTHHLRGEDFDLSKWVLLKVIKGRGGPYLYLFYIPKSLSPSGSCSIAHA